VQSQEIVSSGLAAATVRDRGQEFPMAEHRVRGEGPQPMSSPSPTSMTQDHTRVAY
jgi:hypothetical protein